VTVHRDKFLIIKPTICTHFSNLFLDWNSTCFGQFLCQSSGVFHCTHGNGICHTGLLTACAQDQDGTPVHCCFNSQYVNFGVSFSCDSLAMFVYTGFVLHPDNETSTQILLSFTAFAHSPPSAAVTSYRPPHYDLK